MVLPTSSSTSIKLDSYFTNLINQTMEYERSQRLERLTQQRDANDLKKSIYTDLKASLEALHTQVKNLWSTQSSYALSEVSRKATVTSNQTGSTVLSATASSSAIEATYSITDITLSAKHRVASARQTVGPELALGLNGVITINGKEITISSSDSLYSITSMINSTAFEDGKGVIASVVDQRLVLESKESGTSSSMIISGAPFQTMGVIDAGNNFVNPLSTAKDASFKVNGLLVERSKHTGLTDVINGVTLDFAEDAEGKSAFVKIEGDAGSIKNAVTAFISKYNALQTYLEQKLTLKEIDEKTYERGGLADDYTVRSLRAELADELSISLSSGIFRNFTDLGITMGDDLNISLSDSAKFDEAIKEQLSDVKTFFDAKMTSLDSLLSTYIGTQGTVVYALNNFTDLSKDMEERIEAENTRLNARKELLTKQYAQMQEQLYALQYSQTTLTALQSYLKNLTL